MIPKELNSEHELRRVIYLVSQTSTP